MRQSNIDNHASGGLFKGTPLYIIFSVVLIGVLIFSVLYGVTIGPSDISIKQSYEIIAYEVFGIGDPMVVGKGPIHDVIWLIRLPRLMLALAVGMGLSVVGVAMQAIVKNPLADPYVLGISSGASLGATIAIMLGVGVSFGPNYVGIVAFVGAFLVSIGVLMISNIGGRANSVKLLLAGMALSAVCSAFSSFVVYIADDQQGMQDVTYWLMGSLAGAKWSQIQFILPIIILGTVFFMTQYRTLNLMLLGEEVSITLGKDLHKYRHIYLIITSLMIGLIVYSSGVIGFVGLIIPHIVRMLFGTDHKRLIPLSALSGAIFLIWADIFSRIIIDNAELPIGILVSMIGAPTFIWLMVKKTYGFGAGGN